LLFLLCGAWRRGVGNEMGWEDLVKGDAAVMSFPPLSPLLLLPLLLSLPLPPLGVVTGELAGSKRRVGVLFVIHFVNRS
jgi:hypothetical protein